MPTPPFVRSFMAVLGLVAVSILPGAAHGTAPDGFNTGNDISLDESHPNAFRHFRPELPETLARMPTIDPETGLHVSAIEPGFFYVTDGIYQGAFLVTGDGVVVFDAPPSFAARLPRAIARHAPGRPIRYLVYSHAHFDHIGGAAAFSGVTDLTVIAHEDVARAIAAKGRPGILAPTLTFEGDYVLSVGGETVRMAPASFHAEDTDTILYLPNQKVLMAVDTISAGEVPFMNFGATADVGSYVAMFDTLLAYDFDHFIAGHVSILANRDDVITAKKYTVDVRDTVLRAMPGFNDRMNRILKTFDYRNANLAYRAAIEALRRQCAAAIIDRWADRLSVVDVYADSHCQTMILYAIMH